MSDRPAATPKPSSRSGWNRRLVISGSIGVVIVATFAAVAVAASSGTSRRHAHLRAQKVHAAAVVQQVPSWISTDLSAYKRTQQATDIPPTDIMTSDLRQAGANSQLARFAGDFNGQSVYLVPAANGNICLASTSLLTHGCYQEDDVLGGRVQMMLACYPYMPAEQQETFGMLPGASDVRATYSDGTTHVVPLQGDVFVLDATPSIAPYPQQISWQDAAGQRHSETTSMTPHLPVPHPCTAATLFPNHGTPAEYIAKARARIAAGGY